MAGTPPINFSGTDHYIEAALSGLSARQKAVAQNVANVDTPNFKRGEVKFESVLQQAVNTRGGGFRSQDALNTAMTETKPDEGGAIRADGNNVDIDREMILLADTAMTYNTLTQVMATRLSIMRSVASDGRR